MRWTMKLRRSCTPQNSISPLSTHSSTNDEPLVRLGYCQSIKLIEQERITRASHNRFCSHSFGHFVSVTIYNGVDVLATVAIHIRAHLAHAALHLVAVEVVGIVFAQDTHTHSNSIGWPTVVPFAAHFKSSLGRSSPVSFLVAWLRKQK